MNRSLSAEAEKIIRDQPDFWEYALTGKLIHDWVGPTERRYQDLRRSLYFPTKTAIKTDEFFLWSSTQFEELSNQIQALVGLVNDELGKSWGPPGQPGSVDEIRNVCGYIADGCDRLLAWEERVRAANTDDIFSEVVSLLPGAAGMHIAEILKIPAFIDNMLASGPKGDYAFNVVIALPDEWESKFQAALQRLADELGV
ncbi:hypothetical protein Q8W71_28785 [Methylobacterium sp. NEAU 140]|uniref:hypothetical protein n=1 Tax=Methylobacterium sp. NEAU 140 TaxID=3064945 RepID=UPI0027365714|nr:hypothetical protein [Methylobacterium sp. NEAU 140]MDP4026609.1 hypothetical protein [Methylobacterium sp. NEAU 140]